MTEIALLDLITIAEGLIALVLGGVVGWEREAKHKGAGLRTMMLVSFASYLYIKLGVDAIELPATAGLIQADPIRAIEAIIAGLAFIGAGIVFRDSGEGRARGLTTAASLLTVAPIGISVALGRYVLAVGITLLILLVLHALGAVEDRLFEQRERREAE